MPYVELPDRNKINLNTLILLLHKVHKILSTNDKYFKNYFETTLAKPFNSNQFNPKFEICCVKWNEPSEFIIIFLVKYGTGQI